MTIPIVSPNVQQLHSAVVAPLDLAANVLSAQRAGDLAYDFAVRAGAPLYQRSIAYHVAFAEKMRELGIKPKSKPEELDRARRAFAMRYHPDRVPEEHRERAVLRMQIANMLIDKAKRDRR